MNKATTMRFSQEDKDLLKQVRLMYGCQSDTATIRLALRLVIMHKQQVTIPRRIDFPYYEQ